MMQNEINQILEKHKLWLNKKDGGERANLSKANLSKANLSKADLSKADLSEADLSGADLSGANLSKANLSKADLRWADLSGANLRWADLSKANLSEADLNEANLRWANLSKADLRWADLSGADLSGANLSGADLSEADLNEANLRWANLSGADLSEANLSGANLSGTKGLLKVADYLSDTFEKNSEGYVVYKVFNLYNNSPKTWKIESGSIIEENVNSNRSNTCGCGINVATKAWIKKEKPEIKKVWKLLIKWEWLAGVVVPYNTNGKIRCERAMLLEEVEI